MTTPQPIGFREGAAKATKGTSERSRCLRFPLLLLFNEERIFMSAGGSKTKMNSSEAERTVGFSTLH